MYGHLCNVLGVGYLFIFTLSCLWVRVLLCVTFQKCDREKPRQVRLKKTTKKNKLGKEWGSWHQPSLTHIQARKKKEFRWRVQMSVSLRYSSPCHGGTKASSTIAAKHQMENWQIHDVHEEICHSFQGGTRLRCFCKGRLVVFVNTNNSCSFYWKACNQTRRHWCSKGGRSHTVGCLSGPPIYSLFLSDSKVKSSSASHPTS